MRLFVAIELSEPVRKMLSLAQAELKRKCPDVRWIPPEQLHLTVKFLGEVPDGDVPAVCDAVSRAAQTSESFSMAVGGCGCFPERGAVRIVWAGGSEPSGLLAKCVEAVEAQIEPLGFPRENRPFAAHITIGRVRDDRSGGDLRKAVQAFRANEVTQGVSSLTLMASRLSPKGSNYTPVGRAKLGVADD